MIFSVLRLFEVNCGMSAMVGPESSFAWLSLSTMDLSGRYFGTASRMSWPNRLNVLPRGSAGETGSTAFESIVEALYR